MNFDTHRHRGQEAYEQHKWPEAVFHLEMALKSAPNDPMLLAQLGSALKRAGRIEQAVAVHETLVALSPNAPEALSDLAAAYLAWGRFDEAERRFETAAAQRPNDPELLYNLATAKQWCGKPDQAIGIFRKVVDLAPDHDKAWANLGVSLKAMGKLDAAKIAIEQATALKPDNPDHQWNLALTELLLGDLEKGFQRYEWRRRMPGFPDIGGRPWQGEQLETEALVVFTEQGLGDTLQFIRYLPEAKKRVRRLILRCHPPIATLLREGFDGVDDIVTSGTPFPEVPTAPLMSLPHLLGVTSSLRETVPYLRSSPKRLDYWSRQLFSDGRLRVGICWQGNPRHRDDANRSIPLEAMTGLLRNQEVRFFSLQKYDGREQLRALPKHLDIVDLGDILDEKDAFVDTAAVMACMDIVITIDTSIAHLAGALGRDTWTLLPFVPDFRWGIGGKGPYGKGPYPTMHLFRQHRRNDWSDVMSEVEAALFEVMRPARCLI